MRKHTWYCKIIVSGVYPCVNEGRGVIGSELPRGIRFKFGSLIPDNPYEFIKLRIKSNPGL
jgi:hypothetical protein